MEEEYLSFLEYLDNSDTGALFAQRETGFNRIPFEMERTLYRFIYDGKPEEMVAFYRKMLLQPQSLKVPIGKMSHDQLRQLKYAAVSAVAMSCRSAILGGALEAVSYAKSDDAILQIDDARSALEVLKLEIRTLLDYAALVKQTKSASRYSPVIRACIEYITVHSHRSISLEELAERTPYSKEYLAKLFKSQVGMPISDYMLHTRIDEAKTLLSQGRSCVDVAHIMGFSSQSYFIRQFKRVTGMTPKLYLSLSATDNRSIL